MTTFTFGQLETLWINAGGSPAVAPLMAAIALAESSGDPSKTNSTDNHGTQTSWGLWQVSDGTHNQPVNGILNPNTNAQQAVKKYRVQGLTAWGTYTSGAYKKFMSSSTVPSPISGTTQVGTAQNAVDLNPFNWGADLLLLGESAQQGIETGLTSAFKAIIGPVLQWIWWLGETAAGFVAIGFGVNLLIQNSSAVKEIKSTILGVVPEGKAVQQAVAPKEKAEEGPPIPLEEQHEDKRLTVEQRDIEKRMKSARLKRIRAAQKEREKDGA